MIVNVKIPERLDVHTGTAEVCTPYTLYMCSADNKPPRGHGPSSIGSPPPTATDSKRNHPVRFFLSFGVRRNVLDGIHTLTHRVASLSATTGITRISDSSGPRSAGASTTRTSRASTSTKTRRPTAVTSALETPARSAVASLHSASIKSTSTRSDFQSWKKSPSDADEARALGDSFLSASR